MERIRKYEPLWGEWKATRRIGEGSFGAVYEVKKTLLGNTSYSAVKLISFRNADILRGLNLDDTLSADQLEALKTEKAKKNVREAALMDKLQGRENIVTIHDYTIFTNEYTTDVIIRMELLKNLQNYLKEVKTDEKLVIKIGIDLCKALESCEKENIIHRDIKPANIFVNKDGKFKLGDFGLSRETRGSAVGSLVQPKGTPMYMPPEAYGWGQAVNQTSDIYSLGIVMYQLLNGGNIPFCKDINDPDEVEIAIGKRFDKNEQIPAPTDCREELWDILKKACAYEKQDRYQSAAEMKEALIILRNNLDGKQKSFSKMQRNNMSETRAASNFSFEKERKETSGQRRFSQKESQDVDALLRRGILFLEDGEWNLAGEYFNKVLDYYPECSAAYTGCLCVDLKCKKEENIVSCYRQLLQNDLNSLNEAKRLQPLDSYNNYIKAVRFADNKEKERLEKYNIEIKQAIEEERVKKTQKYDRKIKELIKQYDDGKVEYQKSTERIKGDETNLEGLISEKEKLDNSVPKNMGCLGYSILGVLLMFLVPMFVEIVMTDIIRKPISAEFLLFLIFGVPCIAVPVIWFIKEVKISKRKEILSQSLTLLDDKKNVIQKDLLNEREKQQKLNKNITGLEKEISRLSDLKEVYRQ